MSNWKTLLLRIGEKGPEYGTSSDFKDHIETCFGVIRREIERSGDQVSPYLLQCAEQLPHKIPLYGTLIGLLNLENEDFVRKIVESVQANFQVALDSGNCNSIRILLRFMTSLLCSKVVQPASLIVVFETLLSSAATTVDEEKGNPSWQAQADFYVICILSSLPWGGAELAEQVPDEIERVLVGIQAYLSIRKHSSSSGLNFFLKGESENSPSEKDFLEDLWDRTQSLASNGWKLDSVPRPHLSFEAQLVAGKFHELRPIKCMEPPSPPSDLSRENIGKQKHDALMRYPQRIRRLNIFPANKTEDVQPIDRFVVEEYLLDVLLYLNGCRKECASYMANLPVPFRYEYLMAETLFSQILLLPQPPFKTLYYTLVIMDLCKALPGAFPAVVAGAVRALFEKISDLDMESRTRLILWFSHHLSNFQFIWPWEEWSYVLDLPKWAPKRVFVQEVLQREVRLSYWDKIKQSIENASALEELLPAKAAPAYRYSLEEGKEKTEEHQLSAELNRKVKEKQSARDMMSWIEETIYPVHGFEVTLTVVVQTLLEIGSKSFTHMVTVLERYGQVFGKLCPDNDKQVMLLSQVSAYWKNNAQMTAVAMDRMMGYRLVSNQAIVRWVFSPENVDQFHVSDQPWEILGNALNKTYNRISDLRKDISNITKNVLVAEKASANARAELEAAESKLSLVEGEPVLGENPGKMKRLKSTVEKTGEAEVSLRESLEAKEALLNRALSETEALLLLLFQSFSAVLKERLPEPAKARSMEDLKSEDGNSSAMEVDSENGNPKKKTEIGEREQWCLSTLGYLTAFTRQYANEIWPHMEKLKLEVFSGEDVHPLFLQAIFSALQIPLQ
ncbi:hypothetical protein IGI04_012606 [Brassica rapa subsp. trilocularis]|uniref:MIF4G domain-containing protein n=1 Tax=Brassica rapa subsp. trilocularis TaxID=1813537 RepID=A0ABQ7N6E5_BRACM|nr:hypothetical protein IGI04_012606 [Brassica rapa subsp. trilocularis]